MSIHWVEHRLGIELADIQKSETREGSASHYKR
jgi:hypothetical protein